MLIDSAISDAIKIANAERFAQTHHSELFAWDQTEPEGWKRSWDYIVERVETDNPATILLEKAETKSGEEETFTLELDDVDPIWWLVCKRFGIKEWSLADIKSMLIEDFYGEDLAEMTNPETGKTGDLSTQIEDFLERYPHGGTQGVTCPIAELFQLEA